jgi:methionine-S-sulfoxide reductase
MPASQRLALACATLLAVSAVVYLSGWGRSSAAAARAPSTATTQQPLPDDRPAPEGLEKATLASGCFWCTESDFDSLKGVVSTTSGYTGGLVPNPTYSQVSAGGTGHVESVEVVFDPRVVSFEQILDHYWHNVDFFNDHGQFCDYGEQYRPRIFVHGPRQRQVAEASKARLQAMFEQPVVVDIVDASAFFPAEAYHQDYHAKNPVRYSYYRWSCGRDARLAEIWRRSS